MKLKTFISRIAEVNISHIYEDVGDQGFDKLEISISSEVHQTEDSEITHDEWTHSLEKLELETLILTDEQIEYILYFVPNLDQVDITEEDIRSPLYRET